MPAPATIDWPHDVLGCAARVGYRVQPAALFSIVGVQDGPARYRLVQNEEQRNYSMTFNWTAAQLLAFTTFYHDDLDAGSAWFNMDVLTGAGLVAHVCHFTGSHSITESNDRPGLYVVTTTVEAYSSGNVPPAAFVPGDPVDAQGPAAPSSDIYDAGTAAAPSTPDIVNALTPVAFI